MRMRLIFSPLAPALGGEGRGLPLTMLRYYLLPGARMNLAVWMDRQRPAWKRLEGLLEQIENNGLGSLDVSSQHQRAVGDGTGRGATAVGRPTRSSRYAVSAQAGNRASGPPGYSSRFRRESSTVCPYAWAT